MKYLTTFVAGIAVALTLWLLFTSNVASAALSVLTPSQGGTGIGSATAGQVGDCIKVLDDSPFSYEVGDCATGGSGITSLGGQTGATQTFATTSNAGGFGFSSSGDVHTLNIGTASASVKGLLSATDWSTFNAKESALTFSFPLSRAVNAISFLGLGTSTTWTNGQLAFVTANNSVSSVATTTLTASGALSLSQPISVIGASASVLTCATASGATAGCLGTGDWTAFNSKISSTTIDTLAELETFQGAINIIASTEIDTSTELSNLLGDETGSGGAAVFASGPTLTGTTLFASAVGSASSSINQLTVTLGTTTNATSTNFYALNSTLANVFGVIDAGAATSFEIPNGTAPTVDATGEIAVDTTSGQFKWFDGKVTHVLTGTSSPAFSVASTTQDASGKTFAAGTTTLYLKNDPEALTLSGWYCKASSTGSVIVRFGDGTNWTNQGTCSTTGALIGATTNNTWTAYEDLVVQIGTAATNPSRVTITTVVRKTAD